MASAGVAAARVVSAPKRERKPVKIQAKIILKAKGEETYMAPKQLLVTLKWSAAVDLDLMAFYKTKDGRTGGVFPHKYSGGSEGSLNSFPFIQLGGAGGGENEDALRITKCEEMAEINICTVNFTDASSGKNSTFSEYDSHVTVLDDKGESAAVPLNSNQPGTVAVIARIENTFMGSKLVNENRVMDMATFQRTVPGANSINLS